jgi:DNA-binding MarR family transcriptional regulator
MHTIEELGAPAMTDLARQLGLQPSTVTALIDALVEHGLVERLEDSEDRRMVRVQPTALGRQKKEAHRRAHRKRLMECLDGLEDAELGQIEAALSRLREVVLATRLTDEPSDGRAGDVTR